MSDTLELQKNQLIVGKDGLARFLSEWRRWNTRPWETVRIVRKPDGTFWAQSSTPEGGSRKSGPLEEVLEALFHPKIAGKYYKIFTMQDPDSVRLAGIEYPIGRLEITHE